MPPISDPWSALLETLPEALPRARKRGAQGLGVRFWGEGMRGSVWASPLPPDPRARLEHWARLFPEPEHLTLVAWGEGWEATLAVVEVAEEVEVL